MTDKELDEKKYEVIKFCYPIKDIKNPDHEEIRHQLITGLAFDVAVNFIREKEVEPLEEEVKKLKEKIDKLLSSAE